MALPVGNIVSHCGMVSAGLAYVFSVYSDQIKQKFSLHQNQVLQCAIAAAHDGCRVADAGRSMQGSHP